jgi:acyl carrier protein
VKARPMEVSRARQAIFEALKAASPHEFNDDLRRSFLADGLNLDLADLDMDSLARMEFCIAIEISTNVTLLPSQLAEFASTNAIEVHLARALGDRR